jgi:hypothetical protein
MAQIGRALRQGRQVRVRVTPLKGIVNIEWYDTTPDWYDNEPKWRACDGMYYESTRQINTLAARAATHIDKVPFIIGRK